MKCKVTGDSKEAEENALIHSQLTKLMRAGAGYLHSPGDLLQAAMHKSFCRADGGGWG
jgi:hypothetical protein